MTSDQLRRWSLAAMFATAALAGCGGGGDTNVVRQGPPPPPPPPPPPNTQRGTVLGSADVGTFTTAQIDHQTAIDPTLVNDTATCPVSVVRISYSTIDPYGKAATASLGLLIPDESTCPGPHPLLSQQHGTSVDATFDNASVASNSTAAQLSALYASHGYVVVMPNYLGYAGSSVTYHPYLLAEPSAAVVIDAIRAARSWLGTSHKSTQLSGDVYLAGNSEGGYVTMATQRTMERDFASEFHLVAVSPTSGPYDVSTTMINFMTLPDDPTNSNSTAGALIPYGMQRSYGDVYTDPHQVFNDPWAPEFAATTSVAIPSTTYQGDLALRNNCVIPYNLKDPGGPNPGGCPSNAPLLQAGLVADFLANTAIFSNAGKALRTHAAANSLVTTSGPTFTPQAPVYICYGDLDPMATPNALEAIAAFGARAHIENIQTDPWPPIANFVAGSTNVEAYHGQVEGPACSSWTRNKVFPVPH